MMSILARAAGVAACLGVLSACAPAAPPLLPLKATAKIGRLMLAVTNDSSDDWHAITVTVRTAAGGTAYRHSFPRLDPRATEQIPLVDFVNSKGERFTPLTLSVHHFTVDASTPDGPASVMFEGNQ